MEATGNQMEPGPSDIKKNNNEMSKNNIWSDATHISCCKRVKAKKWTSFHPKEQHKSHITIILESHWLEQKKKNQLFKLGKVQYRGGWGHMLSAKSFKRIHLSSWNYTKLSVLHHNELPSSGKHLPVTSSTKQKNLLLVFLFSVGFSNKEIGAIVWSNGKNLGLLHASTWVRVPRTKSSLSMDGILT